MKTNRYGKVARAFVKACSKYRIAENPDTIVPMDPILDTLPHLRRKEGYSYGVLLASAVGMGDCSIPFAVAEGEKIPEKPMFLTAGQTPPVVDRLDCEFNEDSAWELFLVSDMGRYLPLFWHANYDKVVPFFGTGSLRHVIKDIHHNPDVAVLDGPMTLSEEDYQRMLAYDMDETLLPQVTMTGENKARIVFISWNDWNGLGRITMSVEKTPEGVVIEKEDEEILVEYSCGILY